MRTGPEVVAATAMTVAPLTMTGGVVGVTSVIFSSIQGRRP
jgi:hypothetical protein